MRWCIEEIATKDSIRKFLSGHLLGTLGTHGRNLAAAFPGLWQVDLLVVRRDVQNA
jgi:hypothetical protein